MNNFSTKIDWCKTIERLCLFYSATKIVSGLQKYNIKPSFRERRCCGKTCYSSTNNGYVIIKTGCIAPYIQKR